MKKKKVSAFILLSLPPSLSLSLWCCRESVGEQLAFLFLFLVYGEGGRVRLRLSKSRENRNYQSSRMKKNTLSHSPIFPKKLIFKLYPIITNKYLQY